MAEEEASVDLEALQQKASEEVVRRRQDKADYIRERQIRLGHIKAPKKEKSTAKSKSESE